jgi:hypothetical protein
MAKGQMRSNREAKKPKKDKAAAKSSTTVTSLLRPADSTGKSKSR